MTLTGGPIDRPAQILATAAVEWIEAALVAYSNDRLMQVSALAPLAVEQLAKAVLWRANPVLLAPLDRQQESSFVTLATKPDLRDPRLRTIGLRDVLDRVGKVVVAECPIPKARITRLIDCRNGAVHVGANEADLVRHVLSDSLAIIRWLLPAVGYSEEAFYGTNTEEVNDLLDRQKTEVERRVSEDLARARREYARLRGSISDSRILGDGVRQMEQSYAILELPEYALPQRCPACPCNGRLAGTVTPERKANADSEIDWASDWDVHFSPETFLCFVCKLSLLSIEELEAAKLPSTMRNLDMEQLDFEVEDLLAFVDDAL